MWFPIQRARSGSRGRLARWLVALALASMAGGGARAADGDRRWDFLVGGNVQSSPGVGPDGTIYVGVRVSTNPARGLLFAINRDGTNKWSHLPDRAFRTNDWIDAAPVIGPDGTIYFGSWDGVFYALNPDGSKKWEFTVGGNNPYIASSAAISPDGVIYFGMGDLDVPTDSALIALTPGGVELGTRRKVGDAVDSSPTLAPDGSIYFGSWDGNVYAVNRDRTDKWAPLQTGGPVLASPVLGADGTIYVGSRSRTFVAINPQTGVPRWTRMLDSAINATAAMGADGSIYVGTTGGVLYALDPGDGHTLRSRTFVGFAINSSPAVRGDGTIIFGVNNNRAEGVLHALNPDFTSRWQYTQAGDEIRSSPVVDHDGFIYVGGFDRRLHAIAGSGSPLSRLSTWPSFRHDAQNTGRALLRNSNSKLINLSTRAVVGTSTNLIAGFSVDGNTQKSYLIRAVGPTLSAFNVPAPLRDPTVEVRPLGGGVRAFNDDWETQLGEFPSPASAAPLVGAFPLQPGSKDAAVVPLLEPGRYTALVGTADGGTGTALVEAYDARPDVDDSRLINLSTRGPVGPDVLIPGLVIRGEQPLQLLIRAVGPGLAAFEVPNVLPRPSMSIYSGPNEIYGNTGWTLGGHAYDLEVAARLAGAFPLAANSADSAAIVWLGGGDHTILVSGAGGTSGEVLVEVYILR